MNVRGERGKFPIYFYALNYVFIRMKMETESLQPDREREKERDKIGKSYVVFANFFLH